MSMHECPICKWCRDFFPFAKQEKHPYYLDIGNGRTYVTSPLETATIDFDKSVGKQQAMSTKYEITKVAV